MRLVLVDIGNSAIKLSECEDSNGQPSDLSGTPAVRLASWQDFDFSTFAGEQNRWLLSSVNQPQLDKLTDNLKRDRPQDIVQVVSHKDVDLRVSTDEPSKVGIDRLIAAFAVTKCIKKSEFAVVVDAGTAVTIDLVSGKGEFFGGLIYPGQAASFWQLNEQTAALPMLDFAARKNRIAQWIANLDRSKAMTPWQTNTTDAIAAGIFRTQLAALDQNVSNFVRAIKGDAKVYLTGAAIAELLDAGAALNALPDWIASAQRRTNLVLDGLHAIANRR
jgi:type III pantothenate kinase